MCFKSDFLGDHHYFMVKIKPEGAKAMQIRWYFSRLPSYGMVTPTCRRPGLPLERI
jgi:hypothetical protein